MEDNTHPTQIGLATQAAVDLDASYRYYCRLARKHSNRHRLTLGAVTASMVIAVAFMVSDQPEGYAIAAGFIAAFASIAYSLLDDSRRAGVAASIAALLMDVVDDADLLLQQAKQGDIDARRVARGVKDLNQRVGKITALAALQSGLDNEGDLKAATEEAKKRMETVHA